MTTYSQTRNEERERQLKILTGTMDGPFSPIRAVREDGWNDHELSIIVEELTKRDLNIRIIPQLPQYLLGATDYQSSD